MKEARPKYGSNIPLARKLLTELSERLTWQGRPEISSEIMGIVNSYMTRTYSGRLAPKRKGPPRADQVKAVLELARTTDLPLEEIGRRVGLNSGRVSEIINGLRDAEGKVV